MTIFLRYVGIFLDFLYLFGRYKSYPINEIVLGWKAISVEGNSTVCVSKQETVSPPNTTERIFTSRTANTQKTLVTVARENLTLRAFDPRYTLPLLGLCTLVFCFSPPLIFGVFVDLQKTTFVFFWIVLFYVIEIVVFKTIILLWPSISLFCFGFVFVLLNIMWVVFPFNIMI